MALQYLLAPTFQFVNTAGKPLSGGAYMEVYLHGTRTKYFCASDFDGTLHPFRIPLDSLGANIVLANDTGSYDVYVYNRYGSLKMSRYNVKPGAGGGIGTITSTDGSIDIHQTDDGVDLSVNGLDPSCLKAAADPRATDGKFHFSTLVQEGDQAYVDNEGAIRLIKGWYHFTANVQLAWTAGARNETHQVTLYTTLSNSVIDFDISHVHTETIELSGDVSIVEDGSELVIGVSGLPTGLEARVVGMDVHAITGKDGHDRYFAGNGITISNDNYISADFDEVQEKLVAGQGVTIEGNVISAPSLVQVNSDWDATSGVAAILNKPTIPSGPQLVPAATSSDADKVLTVDDQGTPAWAPAQAPISAGDGIDITNNVVSAKVDGTSVTFNANGELEATVAPQVNSDWDATSGVAEILNKPDLDVFATKTEVNAGLAGKQNTIPDLAAIRSGAQAGASAVQPTDLANVATTGDYNSLNNRPNLSVYATTADMNTALAAKQDVISDLATIRSGAAAGATAVQPAALDSYATKVELNTGLSGKQDTINDLSEIRSGAAAGSTALQPSDVAEVATTGDYDSLSNRPSIPTATSDLTNDSGFITDADVPVKDVEVDGASVVNAQGVAEITMPDLTGYVTTQDLTTGLAGKQDTISDLSTIRSGAQLGSTAVQPADMTAALAYKENSSNKSQTLDPTSTTEFPSSAATANYVNSSVATSTANFLGNFTLADLGLTYPATDAQIGAALDSHTWPAGVTPTNNDYTYIEIENPQTTGIDDSVERFKFNGTNWVYEYTLNNSSFTAAEKAAIDSGIDSAKVAIYDAHVANSDIHVTLSDKSNWNAKQDAISDLSTIRSGAQLGTSAVQPGDLATVALSGSYNDLLEKPSIPAAQINADWDATSGVSEILNKPQFSTVATTGDYFDLQNLPSIPAAQVNSDWDATSGIAEILNKPSIPTATSDLTNDSGFITLSDVPAQVNADWNSSSGASEILNKPTIPSGAQLVPTATSADADKVLTVDAQGTPTWASAQAPISAGNGINIANNVVSVDTSVVATQTDLAGKEDAFDVGTGLEMDTSGSTPTLQVEAPVDIVAGPGIVVDNPDGNTLRVSVAKDVEVVLYDGELKQDTNNTPVSGNVLSETFRNFKRVLLIGHTDDGTEYPFSILLEPLNSSGDMHWSVAVNNPGWCKWFYGNLNGTTITLTLGRVLTMGTTNWDYLHNWTINKVVGIHRIANN